MLIIRDQVMPDSNVAVESVINDLWESMKSHDQKLSMSMLEPTFDFMRVQTDPRRKDTFQLSDYLEHRERDVVPSNIKQ